MTTPTRAEAAAKTPECRLDAHHYCRPGPVTTSYGDVVMTIRCACTCHQSKARR